MVEQGREPHLPILLCYFPHTFQPVWPAFPTLRPALVRLSRVLLGQRPFLHSLRRRSPVLVRLLRRYYAAVRLPAVVHRLLLAGDNGASRFSRMEFLCMHGVFDSAGPRRTCVVVRHVVAFLTV